MRRVKRLLAVMLMTGCSAVTPVPDSGTPGPDAGVALTDAGTMSDAGRADAGVADAGPSEPLFSSSVLYADDFQGYADLGALKASYPIFRELGGALALDTAADAGKSMRIDYAVDADGGCADADVFVSKLVAGDLPTVIATWRFKFEPGFLWVQPASHCNAQGTGSVEFVLTRPADPSGRITLEISAEAENPVRIGTPGIGWRVGVNDAFPTAPRRAVYAAPGALALAQDEWHRVTLAVSRESSVGQGDGVLRMWIDGAIVLELDDASTGTAPFTSMRYPTVLRAGASRSQSRWLDDVVLFAP